MFGGRIYVVSSKAADNRSASMGTGPPRMYLARPWRVRVFLAYRVSGFRKSWKSGCATQVCVRCTRTGVIGRAAVVGGVSGPRESKVILSAHGPPSPVSLAPNQSPAARQPGFRHECRWWSDAASFDRPIPCTQQSPLLSLPPPSLPDFRPPLVPVLRPASRPCTTSIVPALAACATILC